MNKQQIIKMLNYVKENNGGNFNQNGDLVLFKKGYMVGVKKLALAKIDYPNLENLIDHSLKGIILQQDQYFGFWINQNVLFFDIAQNFSSEQEALKQAHNNAELSIYDCTK